MIFWEQLLLVIFAITAAIFFIWGTSEAAVKKVGLGGIFLSVVVILLVLYKFI